MIWFSNIRTSKKNAERINISMVQTQTEYKRYYSLDWIRVLIILNLFPFHTAFLVIKWSQMSFASKLPLDTSILWIYIAFVDKWHMSLLFFIAGLSTAFSLNYRSVNEYIKERIKRILVPLLFGVLSIIPITTYYWPHILLPNVGEFNNGFVDFLKNYPKVFLYSGIYRWVHLWFIAYLFAYSIVSLPLFIFINRGKGRYIISKVADFCEKQGFLLLFSVPLFVIQIGYCIEWLAWPVFTVYRWVFFIYGYLFFYDKRFFKAIEKNITTSLLSGFILTFCIFILLKYNKVPLPSCEFKYFAYTFFSELNTWSWVLAILGLGFRFLNFKNKALEYLNKASYPLYFMHLAVIAVIDYYLVETYITLRYSIRILEFFVISILSFLLSIAIYELFIRRTRAGRFVFGVK